MERLCRLLFFTTKYYHLLVKNAGCCYFFSYKLIYNLWGYSVTEGHQSQLPEDQNLLFLARVIGGMCLMMYAGSSTSASRSKMILQSVVVGFNVHIVSSQEAAWSTWCTSWKYLKRKLKLWHIEDSIQPGLPHGKAKANAKFNFSTLRVPFGC